MGCQWCAGRKREEVAEGRGEEEGSRGRREVQEREEGEKMDESGMGRQFKVSPGPNADNFVVKSSDNNKLRVGGRFTTTNSN